MATTSLAHNYNTSSATASSSNQLAPPEMATTSSAHNHIASLAKASSAKSNCPCHHLQATIKPATKLAHQFSPLAMASYLVAKPASLAAQYNQQCQGALISKDGLIVITPAKASSATNQQPPFNRPHQQLHCNWPHQHLPHNRPYQQTPCNQLQQQLQ